MKKRKGPGFRARELEFSEVVVLLPPTDHEVFAMQRILRFEGRFGVGDLGSVDEDRVARGDGRVETLPWKRASVMAMASFAPSSP